MICGRISATSAIPMMVMTVSLTEPIRFVRTQAPMDRYPGWRGRRQHHFACGPRTCRVLAWPYLSTSAILALNQFMNSDVTRLIDR